MHVLITFKPDATTDIAKHYADCIWAIDTPMNRAMAEQHWVDPSYQGFETTLFKLDSFTNLMYNIDLHHPQCTLLEIHDAQDIDDAMRELEGRGFIVQSKHEGIVIARLSTD